jgi:hypothetical protein
VKQRHKKLRELAKGAISLLYVDENKIVCDQLRPVFEYFFKHVDIAYSCEEAFTL